jgi:glyoxylase I family protein
MQVMKMIDIRAIHHVSLLVSDTGRALGFYQDLLGLEVEEHGGRDRHVALSVADMDVLMAALEAAGVAYTLSRSGRRALFCRDPDGNAIELVEDKISSL